ncbi:uncharacterized protein LOC121106313 isoform X2 [Ursus maritimus]|uniref:Uncharacterized protein LOC121106313 isoform X2 n=1 Tax=Ursus maritimus TaxID=29073 RepID=A0A8M1H2D5_URSMA|nr:uncharacterized protein LOC121106313 isoform X2 [Ursus maritimus]
MRGSRLQVEEEEPPTAGPTPSGFQPPELAPLSRSRSSPVSRVTHLTDREGPPTCPSATSHPAPVTGAKGLPTTKRGPKGPSLIFCELFFHGDIACRPSRWRDACGQDPGSDASGHGNRAGFPCSRLERCSLFSRRPGSSCPLLHPWACPASAVPPAQAGRAALASLPLSCAHSALTRSPDIPADRPSAAALLAESVRKC